MLSDGRIVDGLTVGAGLLPLFDDPLAAPLVDEPLVAPLVAPLVDEPLFDDPEPGADAPDVALPDPVVALPDPGLAGAGLDDGLVLGLVGVAVGVEGGLVGDADGCGADGDVSGCGRVVADGDAAGAAGDAGHVVAGAESRAITGSRGFATPGGGGAAPVRTACRATASACAWPPVPDVWLPPDDAVPVVADDLADWQGEPLFVPAAAGELAAEGPPAGAFPGPVPGEVPAGPPREVPAPVPSTLAGCPPVSTLELTCTTASRSGPTARVAETTSAMPDSTVAGPSRPRPATARRAGASPGGSPGPDSHAGRAGQENREGQVQ